MTLFLRTCMGINMIVLLNKNGANISSAISLEMPARGLIKVKISCHIYRDEKRLTSRSASPIALVDA
jgi:RNA-binding protein YhbY